MLSRCLLHSEKEERREVVADRLIQREPGGREAAGAHQGRGPGHPGQAAGGREADPGPRPAGRARRDPGGAGAWHHLRVVTCQSQMSVIL